jgi:hypothetical protein
MHDHRYATKRHDGDSVLPSRGAYIASHIRSVGVLPHDSGIRVCSAPHPVGSLLGYRYTIFRLCGAPVWKMAQS